MSLTCEPSSEPLHIFVTQLFLLCLTWLHRLQGYLAHKKLPPPKDHHRSLGIGLLYGPRAGPFLMSEVPLKAQVDILRVHSNPAPRRVFASAVDENRLLLITI